MIKVDVLMVPKSQKLATFSEIVVNICDFGYFVTFGHS